METFLMITTIVMALILICTIVIFMWILWKKREYSLKNKDAENSTFYKESQAILPALPVGVAIYDKNVRQEYINDAVATIFGITDIEAHIAKRISLYDDPAISDEIKELIRQGVDIDTVVEYDIRKASETSYYSTDFSHIMYIDGKIRYVKNKKGEIEKYILIINDITEGHIRELKLQRSEINLKLALETGGVDVCGYDINRGRFYPIYGKMLTYEGADIEGASEFMHEDCRGKFIELMGELLSGRTKETSFLNRIINASGRDKYYETRILAVCDLIGHVETLLCSHKDITEDYYQKQRLEESLSKTKLAIKTSGIVQWDYDCSTELFDVANDPLAITKIYITAEEYVSFIHEQDKELVRGVIRKMDKRQDWEFCCEIRMKYPNIGGWQYVTIYGAPIKNDDGDVIRYTGFRQDNTKFIELNQRLNALNKQNELILNNTNLGLVFLDDDFVVQWENLSAFMPDHPMTKNYRQGMVCHKAVRGLDSPCPNCVVLKSRKSGRIEIKELSVHGRVAELTATPIYDDSRQMVVGTVLKVVDITESRTIHTELEAAKNRAEVANVLMKNIIDRLPCLLFIKDVDDDLRHVMVNNYFCEVLGLSAEEIIGKTDYDLFSTKEEAEKCRADDMMAVEGNKLHIFEEETHFQGKRNIWQTTKSAIRTADGHHLMIAISLDITAKMLAYDELQEAKEKAEQSNRLKSAFLANMSHEIRTPLNAIVGFSQLISDPMVDLAEKEEYYNVINTNNELLLRLVNDILDLSKIEAGMMDLKPVIFDVADLFKELFAMFERRIMSDDVELVCISPYNSCEVQMDRNRFTQVITNFLSNAMKFTTKGQITMSYEYVNGGLKTVVSDTGIGIAKDKLSKVFERFEKLDDFTQGTGLGMAICKAIVETYHGEIGVDSECGKGTIFWAWIPIDAVIDGVDQRRAADLK